MESKYYQYCLDTYQEEYTNRFEALKTEHKGRKLTDKLNDEFDREAQKSAIRLAITKALKKFPNESVAELWSAIYRAHLFRKSGISDLGTINKVISADQSWKKSSGHAFEEMVKELASLALYGTGVEIVLQRD